MGGVKRAFFTVVTVLVGVIVVAGSVWFLGNFQKEPAVLAATVVDASHAKVELSIYPNNSAAIPGPETGVDATVDNQGWPFYWPSTTLQLPANTLVTMTIHQYDGSTTVWNPYWAKVHGTVDGKATFNGKDQTEIEPANVAHTFTIHQYPQSGQPDFFLSVPLLAVPSNAKNGANGYPPAQDITFTFKTGGPGTYIWNCEDPCGNGYVDFGGPMSFRGYMSGTVTVV